MKLDVTKLLDEIKAEPYHEITVTAPHCGVVSFNQLPVGVCVYGPSGEYKEVPGTSLATITRENNPRPVRAWEKGVVRSLNNELEGQFVEAGTELAQLRHYLSKDEVVRILLKKTLKLFLAPERAKYYFVPEVDKKVKISGSRSVTVHDGMELFIISRMKREMPLYYSGEEGVIYEIYFQPSQNVDVGSPLIGICPPDQVEAIKDVIGRVQMDWKEHQE